MSDIFLGPIGEQILRTIQGFSNPILDIYFGVVTTFGDTLPILIIIVLLYYTINKEFITRLIYVLIISKHFNLVAKAIFHNPRPYLYDPDFRVTTKFLGKQTVWGAGGFSFPSGHSQIHGSIWSYIFSRYHNYSMIVVGLVLLISIPISRSYLGVHWPGDIIVGVVFGILVSLVFIYIDNNYNVKIIELDDSKKIILGFGISMVLLILGFFALFLGSIIEFNEVISLTDLHFWNEADIGTYPGMLAGIVMGQVLEKKHVDFKTNNRTPKIFLIRPSLGLISVSVLYFCAKAFEDIAEGLQDSFIWSTTVASYIAYLFIAFFIAFVIPWSFTKIEVKLNNH
ncbi:MAG: phosphatase PAP2 family protein [Candidatus Hodarchaeales archaeon]|jgi:membrane-associated phospholipid phosphatase